MTEVNNQASIMRVLILLEPKNAHDDKCPARKNPEKCNCYLLENAKTRAIALDKAGFRKLREDPDGAF